MRNKGFTLIELLIVIAIIGILATLVIVQFGGTRAKARDAKRIAHLSQLATALEQYNLNTGAYPTESDCWSSAACWATMGTALDNYLKSMPDDPTQAAGTQEYHYCSFDNGVTYTITARLEETQADEPGAAPARGGGTCAHSTGTVNHAWVQG